MWQFLRHLLLLSVFTLGGVSSTQAAAPRDESAIRTEYNLRYFPGWDRHTLDVFSPASDRAKGTRAPVVLFVHGGTWMVGDKNFLGHTRGVGKFLAESGYVAVLINYRLSPRVRHPEHVRDVARAFAWTVKNIARHGGDPERIVIAGHSAGAHLATLLVADPDHLADPALKLDAKARKAIRAVVSVCGVYRVPSENEFDAMSAVFVDRITDNVPSRRVNALLRPALMKLSRKLNPFDYVFGRDEDICKKASPIHHARPGLPPMLLLNSESEVPGLRAMTADFAKALKNRKNVVEVKEIEDSNHRTILWQMHRGSTEVSRTILAFLSEHIPPAKVSKRP